MWWWILSRLTVEIILQHIQILTIMLNAYPNIWKALTNRFMIVLLLLSVVSDSLRPHELQHSRLPWPSPAPGACSNSCPLSQWCHPTLSSSVAPFSSCLQSFPATESFPMSQLFIAGGQSIGALAPAPETGESWNTTILALKTEEEATSQGMQAASRSGKRQGNWFPLESPEGRQPC